MHVFLGIQRPRNLYLYTHHRMVKDLMADEHKKIMQKGLCIRRTEKQMSTL